MSEEEVWWLPTLPAFESTGGIATVLTCVRCGASVTVTVQDARAAELHIAWHEQHDA